MRSPCRLVALALLALAGWPLAAHAQYFIAIGGPDGAPAAPPLPAAAPGPRPWAGVTVFADHAGLADGLAAAPEQRFDAPLAAYGLRLQLPDPTGALIDCFVARAPVMEPALAARFPDLRTFIVQSADASANGRMELAPRGLTAMLRTNSGETWMIDPAWSADPAILMSYHLRDLPGGSDWTCHTDAAIHGRNRPVGSGGGDAPSSRALQSLRTVRVAMACTGEYGVHHSTIQGHAPNVADPLAAIVTVISRVNVVYEADLGVHFNLVADETNVVFFNPGTDPFPDTCDGLGGADCSSPILGALPGALSSRITSPYDLSHCLTRIAGGVAYLNDVCHLNGGVSGIPRGGDVDPFSALVVMHEFGHQFGANHTFSGTRGRCGNNANLATAWEAGSGSSPMAYAGGCPVGDAPPSDNIVQFAEPFFHHGSLEEMRAFVSSAACVSVSATSNHTPDIVSVTANAPIPPGTPFTLTAAATDSDGDALSYSWEQFDNGARRPLSGDGSADDGTGSLFRIFTPTSATSRTFPKMADVLAGVPTPGERLPTVTGVNRRFRVLVRDNHPGAGGTATSGLVTLAIASGASPFAVTAPAPGASLVSGAAHPATVTWSVGNTNAAPISAASVTIRLSTDDGATFPVNLGTFPNNGSASVTFPVLSTSGARVRLDPVGKIFFAVSRPFTLLDHCPADFNGDTSVDDFDFFDFLNAFNANNASADFNGDTAVDDFDYFDFLNALFGGC
ncbi:MAG: hypothetical protein JNM07_13715 [Phycisphaerae bacterium]|nr:hypothetical protein [Phycisphaerae bacterium]